jgi:glycosyltransferase involved in cell wall biosynthesis
MFISFIIPAYNEEALIGETVERLKLSARDCMNEDEFEIIVVDDDSSDRTASIARECGARVVPVKRRQIAAVRNAGAAEAKGDVYIFVDADTLVPVATLQAAIGALQNGAIGGGAAVRFDDKVSRTAQALGAFVIENFILCRTAAGCFVYCRREAFEAVGGFDERFYASEEVWISKALKQHGKFVMVREPVITSGRKIRMHGLLGLLWTSLRILSQGMGAVQRREGLEVWYDGRREGQRKRSEK